MIYVQGSAATYCLSDVVHTNVGVGVLYRLR